ncbi:hypothetical protein Tco_0657267 [Tanacetum coccineum]|uniref:Uncharacterized protein n=1 Tax=Tanacetum coccineum TaxID=301880 RepID=A0ABQ4XBW0_9ASTR
MLCSLTYIYHLKESLIENVLGSFRGSRVVKTLDNALIFACQIHQLSQELFEYVIGTCPKKVAMKDDNKAPLLPLARPSAFVVPFLQILPYIPPTDKDLEILFQRMFNEYFDQSTDGEPVPMATVVNATFVSTIHLFFIRMFKIHLLQVIHCHPHKCILQSFLKVLPADQLSKTPQLLLENGPRITLLIISRPELQICRCCRDKKDCLVSKPWQDEIHEFGSTLIMSEIKLDWLAVGFKEATKEARTHIYSTSHIRHHFHSRASGKWLVDIYFVDGNKLSTAVSSQKLFPREHFISSSPTTWDDEVKPETLQMPSRRRG